MPGIFVYHEKITALSSLVDSRRIVLLPTLLIVDFFQGGRLDFSRREVTALVGGPGNMAVYRIPFRHILVLPLPPKKYRQL